MPEMDEYERRIREKVFSVLTTAEWVYLVGVFQAAKEYEDSQEAKAHENNNERA
jgi:hypothetical protein